MEELIAYILQFGNLNKQQIDLVKSKARELSLQKDEFFSEAGKIPRRVGFVVEGVLRGCYYNNKGEEITRCFIGENSLMVDYLHFEARTASAEQDIKKMGVTFYETFVVDGHTDYYGANDYKTTSPAKYEPLTIAEECNKEQFIADLKEHQQGKTDYPTLIGKSAKLGVEKWAVCMDKMTCTYYDKAGNEVLVEDIPH